MGKENVPVKSSRSAVDEPFDCIFLPFTALLSCYIASVDFWLTDLFLTSNKIPFDLMWFDLKEHCLLCGESAQFDSKHPNSNKVSHVEALEIHVSILQCCAKRCDSCGMEVQSRLNTCNDLILQLRLFIMVALCNRADQNIFILFLSSFFFFFFSFSSPNLSGRRLDVYHTLAHGVALVWI